MKKTLKLTFIYFKESLFSLTGGTNKKSGRKTLPALIALFAFVALALGYSLYNIGDTLKMLSMEANVLMIGLLMGVIMSLMINLNDTQGTMYKSKDYDMLMSLPIRNVSIITAKYLSTYFVTMLYFLIVALPTFVVYFIFNAITVWGILFAIISVLFIPAFSQFISSVLGWLINILTSRMQNKNIMRVIFSLITAVGLAVFISVANSEIFNNMFAGGVPLWFKIVFANIYFLFIAITEVNALYFLASVGISIGFAVLSILILCLGFKKINSSLQTTRVKRKNKPLTYKSNSVTKSLLKKEAVTFFNSPVYCVNGLVGIIMCVVVTIITTVIHSDLREIVEAGKVFAVVEIFCMAMCAGVAPTTSVSVSMEGSKFQNLKSLPINFKQIAFSKMALNILIGLPIILICVIVFSCIVSVGVLIPIFMMIYIICAVFAQTITGLLINLRFPKLNWSSETQAAKGGISLILTMLINIFLSIIPFVCVIILATNVENISIELMLGLSTLFEAIVLVISIVMFYTQGKKLFDKIQV